MADGNHKSIENLKVGDKVKATDPATNKSASREVTATITGAGDKRLVTITIDTDGNKGDKTATLTATDGHPFWVANLHKWINAKDLKPGYRLETADHRDATITGIRTWNQYRSVYNLTVDTTHTYYIAADTANILIHNCGGGLLGSVKSFAYEAKRLINVPRAWLNNRALARSLEGARPEPNATVRDLLGFRPGNAQRPGKLFGANARSDDDLLNSVFAPGDDQFIATNSSMPNTILQGNHRVYQLLSRAADPNNKFITYATRIFINRGDW
jgi:hypothetical protein